MSSQAAAKIKQLALLGIFNLVVAALCFINFEGLASAILFFHATAQTQPVAERYHTRYDELLGWVNIPNVYIKDMYGPNVYLQINSQGFRNNQDFSVQAPPGKLRIICSGDSFTFGYGVNNDQAWCQRLAAVDERLETVNMGQGGYGVDQAYLWYKRNGQQLEHDIHIFAFITTDFKRMMRNEFSGYGKPLLQLQNDTLVVTHVPVPKRFFYVPWLTQNREAVDELKSVQLLDLLFFQDEAEAADSPADQQAPPEMIAAKILADLVQLNKAKNSTLVLVYLPGQNFSGEDLKKWRRHVHVAAEQQGILFLDLVDEFKDLPAAKLAEMFIPKGAIDYQGAAGHYTVKGNEYVAKVLYERLLALPEISSRFSERVQR